MKSIIRVIFALAIMIAVSAHQNSETGFAKRSDNSQQIRDPAGGITREEATRVAKAAASKRFRLKKYDITACEGNNIWTVFFELRDPHSDGRGPEYVISKVDGEILTTTLAPHGFKSSRNVGAKFIDRAQAIEISERNLGEAGSLTGLSLGVCELTRVWVIAYFPETISIKGGGISYVIDKRSGRIVSKTAYL